MAVQLGTAHSASVVGVAATAGGPYFCAQGSVITAITRCMAGDPAYPSAAISDAEKVFLQTEARTWSVKNWIDEIGNLGGQRVWLFHGYNDGIVKKTVSDALQNWYDHFVPTAQSFYKNDLPAAHGQISAACPSADGGVCSPCAEVGGNFINVCADGDESSAAYDAAGSLLQFFYGPLRRTARPALQGRLLEFDQTPHVRESSGKRSARTIGMARKGYVYVPAECALGQPCRLHIAFHGCMQYAERIGTAFADYAGFNEWADANRIIVLYPQALATSGGLFTPLNPQGCWDWWGYTDNLLHRFGRYATRDGAQISAVWSMAKRLAGESQARIDPVASETPLVNVVDRSASQVMLNWPPVTEAAGYHIYRQQHEDAAPQRLTSLPVAGPSYVDSGLLPQTRYRYQLRTVDIQGNEQQLSAFVDVTTSAAPPPCDPYYSLSKGERVDAAGKAVAGECR